MKTTHTFTSTIAPDVIAWVDRRARAKKTTRRSVLEEAVRNYRQNIARRALAAGFKRAIGDTDMLELAEWGMDDYADVVR